MDGTFCEKKVITKYMESQVQEDVSLFQGK